MSAPGNGSAGGRVREHPELEKVLAAYREGRPVVVRRRDFDDQAHLVLAAGSVSSESLRFLIRHGSGRVGLVLTPDRCEALDLATRPPVEDALLEPLSEGSCTPPELDLDGAVASRLRELAAAEPPAPGSNGLPSGLKVYRADWAGAAACPTPLNAVVDLARLAGINPPAAVVCRLDMADGNGSGDGLEAFAVRHGLQAVDLEELIARRRREIGPQIAPAGFGVRLPTRHGVFDAHPFEDLLTGAVHLALVLGDLDGPQPALTRMHSECLTGDVLGSLRCDCGSQLDLAMERIGSAGGGVILYLRQEGRGIGLLNKLRAYALQDQGLDTVEANLKLGFAADLREFTVAAEMLVALGVRRVRLLTNNPRKIDGLRGSGVEVVERLALPGHDSHENRAYLSTKRRKLGHLLDPGER